MKKNKFVYLLLLLFLAFVFIFSHVKNPIVKAIDYATNYTVGITSNSEPESTIKVSDLNQKLYIYAKNDETSGTSYKSFKIKYKTLDGNLVASSGDYTSIDQTITINSVLPNKTATSAFYLSIKTRPRVTVGNGEYYFYILIYEVNDKEITDPTSYELVKIVVEPEYSFETTSKGNSYGDVISEFASSSDMSSTTSSTLIDGNKIDLNPGVEKVYKINVKNSLSKLYDAGLADAYIGFTGSFSAPTWGSYPQDWLQTTLYQNESDYSYTKYAYRSNFYTINDVGWDNIFPGSNDQGDYKESSTITSKDNLYNNTIGDGATRIFRNGSQLAYYKINDPNKALYFTLRNVSAHGSEWEAKNWYYNTFVFDNTTPTYKNAYIVDNQSVATSTTKIKMVVEFSEPVQLINSENSTITAFVNSNLYYEGLTLKYVSGVGTTRLVYELEGEYPQTTYSTKIDRISFNNTTIRDFSYNANYKDTNKSNFGLNNADLSSSFACDLDFVINTKTPSVEITKSVTNENAAPQTNDLTIKLNSTSSGFTFKYALIENGKEVSDDDYVELSDFKLSGDSSSSDSYYYYVLNLGYGLNGTYDFYYKLTSAYGIEVNNLNEKITLKFDNTAPVISNLEARHSTSDGNVNYNKYDFSFTLEEGPFSTINSLDRIDSIYFVYSNSPLVNNSNVSYYNIKDKLTVSDNLLTFSIDGSIVGVDTETLYKDLHVGIVATDAALNSFTLEDTEDLYIRFDSRNKLDGDVYIDGNLYNNFQNTYVITDSKPTVNFTRKVTATEISKYNYEIQRYDGSKFIDISDYTNEDYKKYYSYTLTKSDTKYSITILKPGYYKVQFNTDNTQYSDTYEFYAVSGNDKTNNYSSVQYSVNKVYSTNSNKFYYYNSSGSIDSIYYNDVNKSQMFSTEYLRNQYLKYYEYSDLYAIKITEEQATSLNSSISSTYKKASGETTVAESGQIWIRYKRSDWSFSTSTSDWVYYYYGNYANDTINVSYLSNNVNLTNAISSVVTTIENNCGSAIYLIDDGSGESITTLDSDQIHTSSENFNETRCGKTIINANFVGDTNLYDSVYVENEVTYYLYSNAKFEFSDYTKIFIAKTDVSGGTDYREISYRYSKTELKTILKSLYEGNVEGKYKLIEIDENGASETNIYIVSNAPSILVDYVVNDETTTNFQINTTNNGETFRFSSLYLKGFANVSAGYVDNYQYILVRNNSTLDSNIYYKGDFSTYKTITNGRYTIIVSDRFGNTYSFTAIVDSTKTDFTLSSVENEYVRFTSELDPSSVFSFEVKLNGTVISTTYGQNLTFRESGLYEFVLTDQNQKSVTKSIELTRVAPSVTIRMNIDDEYVSIDDSSKGAIIEKQTNSLYYIYTNKFLVFSYSGDYSLEISGDPTYNKSVVLSQTRIEITSASSFSIKFYYTDFSYNYVTYVVIYDDSNPSIKATSFTNDINLNDIVAIQNGPTSQADSIKDIGFTTLGTKSEYTIVNNGQVYSSDINITVSDASTIKSVDIYLDGEIISSLTNINSKEYKYSLEKQGSYRIIAKDILGNTSEFSFDNKLPDLYKEYLDSNESSTSFDLDEAYETVKYAYSSVTYRINNFELFALNINNNVYYITLNSTNVYMYYMIPTALEGTTNYTYERQIIVNTNLEDNQKKKLDINIEGIEVYATYDNTYLYLEIKNVSNEIVKFITRLTTDYSNTPFYSNIEMYNVKSTIHFIDSSNDELTVDEYKLNYYKSFSINSLIDENITNINYGYSKNSTKEDMSSLDLTKLSSYVFGDKNGYYFFDVINKYGNTTSYIISIYKDLDVTIDVTYKDETNIKYNYSGDIYYYSNNYADIKVNSVDVNVSITSISDPELNVEIVKDEANNTITFRLDKSLDYRVLISDNYQNTKNFNLQISESDFPVNNDILTGFNEKALRKDELYTNMKLSLAESKIEEYGIYYMSYRYANSTNEVVLFDRNQSDSPLISLNNVIGNDGDGSYYLILRDKFGNICAKEIHYAQNSVFNISKKILTEDTYNTIQIDDDGYVYSNDILEFSTSAKTYKFTIDSKDYNCPYTMQFHEASLTGSYTYQLYYLDEYGFEYSFTAVLLRTEITSQIDQSTTEINGVTSLTKDFSISFDESYNATYSINNVLYTYNSNTLLHEDGLYTFVISDKAGNIKTLNIFKDSVVSFTAYERDTERAIILGDVSSNGNVSFKATREGEYLTVKKAYLNGVLKESQETVFTDNGKWEVLISDEIGNLAYFTFYIYTHVLSEFSYDSPYNYIFTRIDYTNRSGTTMSYLDKVIQHDTYSSVVLGDNGTYDLYMTSLADRSIVTFSIEINDEKPNVSLVGVENNGTTSDNVTIQGYQVGDVIRIYKDNTLLRTINVLTSDMSSPVISELGDYRIEVTNTQGNTTVLEFKRQYTANSASSILIIVILVVVSSALFAGLFFRKREKID